MVATENRVQVESFECVETASEPIEATEEVKALIEELGLDGQLERISKDKNGNVKRSPYREMTEEETFVYQELCPEKSKIENYTATPIPLRVLQIAAHAKQVIPGCRLIVWDKAKHDVKDPVLVAETGKEYSTDKRFILARWGDELETFSTLMSRAISAKRMRLISELKSKALAAESLSESEIIQANWWIHL